MDALKLAEKYFSNPNGGYGTSEFTDDEWGVIAEFVNAKFTAPEGIVLSAYNFLMREFQSGHRCSVCGRTEKQNKALDYDCVREC